MLPVQLEVLPVQLEVLPVQLEVLPGLLLEELLGRRLLEKHIYMVIHRLYTVYTLAIWCQLYNNKKMKMHFSLSIYARLFSLFVTGGLVGTREGGWGRLCSRELL